MCERLINHSYSVPEIERMRRALRSLLFPIVWFSSTSGETHGSGRPGDDDRRIEGQLRTYMLAGTRPEELETLAAERAAVSERERLRLTSS